MITVNDPPTVPEKKWLKLDQLELGHAYRCVRGVPPMLGQDKRSVYVMARGAQGLDTLINVTSGFVKYIAIPSTLGLWFEEVDLEISVKERN